MAGKVVQVVVTPVLQVAHQTLAQAEHKLLAAPVAFQSTAFRALQEPNTQVVILAMNPAAVVVATSAVVAAEITAVAVVAQATSIHEQLPAHRHRQEH